ncbi:hypothetical protein [Actinomadura sp. NEAU-AAG7]|uniref:hypothetical protein n=1 Tax=Actinomadura sp. NEAU-AAG7 TaxID=2839640 RepID=UPI001BE41F0C|nr:hypothetical protein [Actinomadura sp. NEAU-AAG7]MBT2210901.1 hypothetical protein [Actinomadura sp. NEAU-AAG7]
MLRLGLLLAGAAGAPAPARVRPRVQGRESGSPVPLVAAAVGLGAAAGLGVAMTAHDGPVADDVLGCLLLGLGLAGAIPVPGVAEREGGRPAVSLVRRPATAQAPPAQASQTAPAPTGAGSPPAPACPSPRRKAGRHDCLTRERAMPMDGPEIDWP